jgi:L-fucose isomerase-like protein
MIKFTYSVLASVLHDSQSVDMLFSAYEPFFSLLGGERKESPATGGSSRPGQRFQCLFILTGGTEGEALKCYDHDLPAIVVAHPRHNSLPAALEIVAKIRREGGNAFLVFARGPEDREAIRLMEEYLDVFRAIETLGRTRIGAVGEASDWLVASNHGSEICSKAWGVELVNIPIEEVREGISEQVLEEANLREGELFRKAEYCREVTQKDLDVSETIYRRLAALAKLYRLDALTLRCFDLVTGDGATGCYALSRLADEGIDAGCEGDIPSIIGLVWMRALSGRAAWMANPSDIEFEGNTARLLLAHCTVPRGLLSSYGVRSHFESGLGIAIAGKFAAGTSGAEGGVTLVRIGGENLDQLWVAEGRIIESPSLEGLCRTQARVEIDRKDGESLMENPLGNHIVMALGHHGAKARNYLRIAGLLQTKKS